MRFENHAMKKRWRFEIVVLKQLLSGIVICGTFLSEVRDSSKTTAFVMYLVHVLSQSWSYALSGSPAENGSTDVWLLLKITSDNVGKRLCSLVKELGPIVDYKQDEVRGNLIPQIKVQTNASEKKEPFLLAALTQTVKPMIKAGTHL